MEELKLKILDLCNSSGLPLECVMYVLKDAWRDAEATLRAAQAQFPQGSNIINESKEEKEQ